MDRDRFEKFITEGLTDARVEVSPNGQDFEVRVSAIRQPEDFAMRCARISKATHISVSNGEILVLFIGVAALMAEPPRDGGRLTQRQRDVAELLAMGLNSHEIAATLEVSVKTIDTHRGAILKRLKLRNNAELARYYALRQDSISA